MNWDCVDKATGVATLQCVPTLFKNIINGALIFAGATAVVLIILSGIKFIWSGGDPKKVEGARKNLTYAIVGLVVIFVSFGIINLIAYVTGANCILLWGDLGFGACQ